MTLWWDNGLTAIYHADARSIPLSDRSVHCAVMSPPYWSLRDYGLGHWNGGSPDCDHLRLKRYGQQARELPDRYGDTASYGGDAPEPWPGAVCGKCGATRQAEGIGLEPTLDDWVANILIVMREVHRVLRDDGSLWINLGDAYVGSGRGANGDGSYSHGNKQAGNHGSTNLPIVRSKRNERGVGSGIWNEVGGLEVQGLPAKNLMFQPHRVAQALQRPWVTCRGCESTHHETAYGRWPDGRLICPECWESHGVLEHTPGWIVRQTNHWGKTNPMPESTRDRSSSAVEYVFHCVKTNRPLYWVHDDGAVSTSTPPADFYWVHADCGQEQDTKPPGWGPKNNMGWTRVNRWQSMSYFYDGEAVREQSSGGAHPRRKDGAFGPEDAGHDANDTRHGSWMDTYVPRTRNLRNVWLVPTQGRKDQHFASFPDRLPELCILAGTSERGVCAQCGNPWVRDVEKVATGKIRQRKSGGFGDHYKLQIEGRVAGGAFQEVVKVRTIGWKPTCECGAPTVPATVLDPFVGRGTTAIVAQGLGRRSVGLDLNREYLDLARRNLEAVNLPLERDEKLQPAQPDAAGDGSQQYQSAFGI